MKANLKANLAWLGVMVVGFVAIDGFELMGLITSFI